MVKMHKHAGVVRSDTGTYRMHPISTQHKDPIAKRAHTVELKKKDNTSDYKQSRLKVNITGTHKHKGYETPTGALKSHPVMQNHKDLRVQKWHKEALKKNTPLENLFGTSKKSSPEKQVKKRATTRQKLEGEMIGIPIDKDGYVSFDMDSVPKVKGIRLKFTRRENGKKRTAEYQIDNKPFKLRSGEFIKRGSKKEVINIKKK